MVGARLRDTNRRRCLAFSGATVWILFLYHRGKLLRTFVVILSIIALSIFMDIFTEHLVLIGTVATLLWLLHLAPLRVVLHRHLLGLLLHLRPVVLIVAPVMI